MDKAKRLAEQIISMIDDTPPYNGNMDTIKQEAEEMDITLAEIYELCEEVLRS